MKLKKEIKDKILNDNDFSLRLSLRIGIQQTSLFRAVKRDSVRLLRQPCLDFYIENGFSRDNIIDIAE